MITIEKPGSYILIKKGTYIEISRKYQKRFNNKVSNPYSYKNVTIG